SATFAGSAYQVSFAGGPERGAGVCAPLAGPGAEGGGGMQRRRKVPDQSRPAAVLAAPMKPSTVLAGVCADATPIPADKTTAAVMHLASDFILVSPFT